MSSGAERGLAVEVVIGAEARADVEALGIDDAAELKDVKRAIVRRLIELSENAYLGEKLGDRPLSGLRECRKLRVDREGRRGLPRFRIVYSLSPTEGAPAKAEVWAISSRANLEAYRKTAARLRAAARKR